jgi:hypothetical protein
MMMMMIIITLILWFLGSWSSSVSIVSDYRLSLQLMSLLHSGGKS